MSKIVRTLLSVIVVLVAVGLTLAWFDQPRRTTERFVGNMYHERYEEAADMLVSPSALSVNPDGGLLIVDRDGRSISVPRVQLPFLAGGHDGEEEHDFKMTALGPSTDGILHQTPVTLYLTVAGGEVVIAAMEN